MSLKSSQIEHNDGICVINEENVDPKLLKKSS